jgi:NADH:ubiquinone oxidoreductase subunit E
MTNPDEWNEEKIATYFKLPSNSVENLIKYYSDFNVQEAPKIPEPLA